MSLDPAEADLRRAHSLAPGDPRYIASLAAFLMFERSKGNPSPEVDGLVTHLMREGRTAAQLELAARYLLARQRPEAAMRLVRRALASDSSCWRCYETLAYAASAKEQWKLAVFGMRIAAHGRPTHRTSQAALTRLAEYEARLKAHAATPTKDAPGAVENPANEAPAHGAPAP